MLEIETMDMLVVYSKSQIVTRWYTSLHTLLSMKVVVVLLFYVHGKHLRSCRDGQHERSTLQNLLTSQ